MISCLLLIILGLAYFAWKYPNLRKAWFFPPHKGLVALMYHHIAVLPPTPQDQYTFAIAPDLFEKQLLFLQENNYTPITVDQVLQSTKPGNSLIQRPVLLTFDDATQDHYTQLFPLLQKYRVPALIFVITDFVGRPGYMTWDQIRQMQQSGLVEFGSHTCSHRRLRELSQEEILKELAQSKKIIEANLPGPVRTFCYPFGAGAFDKKVRPLVFKTGYQLDFSTKRGINAWPWNGKTIRRAFPRGGETLWDFHLQLTRGRSQL